MEVRTRIEINFGRWLAWMTAFITGVAFTELWQNTPNREIAIIAILLLVYSSRVLFHFMLVYAKEV